MLEATLYSETPKTSNACDQTSHSYMTLHSFYDVDYTRVFIIYFLALLFSKTTSRCQGIVKALASSAVASSAAASLSVSCEIFDIF